DDRQAIRFTANARFKVLGNGRLRLPKIGGVDVRWSRELPSDPSSVTIIKDAAGRYVASLRLATYAASRPMYSPRCSGLSAVTDIHAPTQSRNWSRSAKGTPMRSQTISPGSGTANACDRSAGGQALTISS